MSSNHGSASGLRWRARFRKGFCAWIVGSVLLAMLPVSASTAQGKTSALAESGSDALVQQGDRIAALKLQLPPLESRLGLSEGVERRVLEARLVRDESRVRELILSFAEEVADREENQEDVSRVRGRAIRGLEALPGLLRKADQRIRSRVVFPATDASAVAQAATDSVLDSALRDLHQIDESVMQNLEISSRLGLDVSREEARFKEELIEQAANLSIFLDLSLEDASSIESRQSLLPEDAELKAQFSVTQNRVEFVSSALGRLVHMMGNLNLDAHEYEQQLLTVTGEIGTNFLEWEVIGGLLSRWAESFSDSIVEGAPGMLLQSLFFVAIILAFRKFSQLAEGLVDRGLEAASIRLSQLLHRMVVATVKNLIFLLGVLIALSQFGVSLVPLLAGLGIAGFIIGFALQDSLSNFASGMMILLYRPYDVGDLIETMGVFGRVHQMSLVNTTIPTLDNQTIVVPNNKIWGDVIKNVTAQDVRRVDLVFGISYGDDIRVAETILQEIVESHEKVLADPEPMVKLHELGDSSVNLWFAPGSRPMTTGTSGGI